jgi:hypothetical protein
MVENRGAKEAMKNKSYDFLMPDSDKRQYFGFKLKALLALSTLGIPKDDYRADYHNRHLAFLNNLTNSQDERFTFEIRIISKPDPDLYTRGRITMVFLCRMDSFSVEEAEDRRIHLQNLLGATFHEYEFESIPSLEIPQILRPFDIGTLVEIRRRIGQENLDSLAGTILLRQIGFTLNEGSAAGIKKRTPIKPHSLFHVYPFIHSWSDFGILTDMLLMEPFPIAISLRIRPTQLASGERHFFEDQIASCETAIHGGTRLQALQLQAQVFERFQSERLYGLRDNAAMAVIEIASPFSLPAPIIDTVGSLVTEAAGRRTASRESGWESYYTGGYEVIPKTGVQAKRDFAEIEIHFSSGSIPSKNARRIPFLFDSLEAASFFRFPWATDDPPAGLPSRNWKSFPPPDDLPDRGARLGIAVHRHTVQPVLVGPDDRKRHVYVVGQTGTGKTTLLKTMMLEDMRSGEGLCLLDPHGDLYKDILEKIPAHRIQDVILIDPTDLEFPVALNMLECKTQDQRYFLCQEFVGIIRRLMQDEYGRNHQMTGPIFFQHMRMNLLLTMSAPDDPGTLLEFYNIFQVPDFWKRWLPLKISDPLLERWVNNLLPQYNYTKPGSGEESVGGYISSKFHGFIFDPLLRNIFGQKRTLVNLRSVMDEGKILLVNLAKGELTEENSRFLGMVFMAKLMYAAMGRVGIPEHKRRHFNLYVDEFQSLATSSFVTMLSEARKFGLNLVLANQFLTQIDDPQILQAVFGNVGTTISFRLGPEDAGLIERKFHPVFNRFDLVNLPNWTAYISTLVKGQVTKPFSFTTIIDPEKPSPERAEAVRMNSRKLFTRPKETVESEIEFYLAPPRKEASPGIDIPELRRDDENDQ